jgi:hypothetical protein
VAFMRLESIGAIHFSNSGSVRFDADQQGVLPMTTSSRSCVKGHFRRPPFYGEGDVIGVITAIFLPSGGDVGIASEL